MHSSRRSFWKRRSVRLLTGLIAWTTKGDINWDGEVSFSIQSEKMSVDADGNLRALNAAFNMLKDGDKPGVEFKQ